MKAFLLIGRDDAALSALTEHLPTVLVPLGDRPFLQHLIEYLVGQGIREFEVFSFEFPEKIEALLGDGTRWGSRITCHLGRNEADLWRRFRLLARKETAPILVCTSGTLVFTPVKPLFDEAASGTSIVLTRGSVSDADPVGWFVMPPTLAADLPDEGDGSTMQSALAERLLRQGRRHPCGKLLPWRTFNDFLAGQRLRLEGAFPDLLCNAREAAPGIRIERNVSLHPTAQLIPPVFIGENVQIADRVKLGPNVVISPNCIVDSQAVVKEALVLSGSYIGETLEVERAIVRRNRIINLAIGGAVDVADDFILGNIGDLGLGIRLRNLFWRLVAAIVLTGSLPVTLILVAVLAVARRGELLFRREGVRLPTDRAPETLETFDLLTFRRKTSPRPNDGGPSLAHLFLDFLPGLMAVIRGDISMVGLPVRSSEEVRRMFPDWQRLYLKGRVGLISETLVAWGDTASDEEAFLADAYYRARQGFGYDLRLLFRYLSAILKWPGSEGLRGEKHLLPESGFGPSNTHRP